MDFYSKGKPVSILKVEIFIMQYNRPKSFDYWKVLVLWGSYVMCQFSYRYAYRDHMTDVIVQHLLTDEKGNL